jgi:hypothetical protein
MGTDSFRVMGTEFVEMVGWYLEGFEHITQSIWRWSGGCRGVVAGDSRGGRVVVAGLLRVFFFLSFFFFFSV